MVPSDCFHLQWSAFPIPVSVSNFLYKLCWKDEYKKNKTDTGSAADRDLMANILIEIDR